jgi:5'-nucleotidase
MTIFLTNDDGIDGHGFLDFAAALTCAGCDVFVVAPDSNRSGTSHSLPCLHSTLKLQKRGPQIWACSGSPADCAGLAVMGGLGPLTGRPSYKPDLLVSGINEGANLGTDLIFSGTAGAASHGALYNIPSIALSLVSHIGVCDDVFHWKETIAYCVAHLEEFASYWKRDTFVNVNLPRCSIQGSRLTYPSLRRYTDTISVTENDDKSLSCTLRWGSILNGAEPGSDWDAISQGCVSISPVFLHPVVRKDLCPDAPAYASVAPRPSSIPNPETIK